MQPTMYGHSELLWQHICTKTEKILGYGGKGERIQFVIPKTTFDHGDDTGEDQTRSHAI